jgi:Fe-S-cluster-containing hydrogenase component 2
LIIGEPRRFWIHLGGIDMGLFHRKETVDVQEKTLVVVKARCPQNHMCPAVRVCPVGALSQNGFSAPQVDFDKCIRCGKCVHFCPMRALRLQ